MHTEGVSEELPDDVGSGVLVHVSASESTAAAEQLSMTKTIVIAMSCVVAYLGVMAALTVYCLIHMVRARRLRKHAQLHDTDERQYNYPNYTVSQKNIPDIFDFNLKTNYDILTIFGENISDTTCHQMTIQFPTSPSVCFCTT